jgi:RNA polymerase sigma-70 factor (ECF subfamily)
MLGAAHQRLWLIAAAVTGDRTEADDVVQDAAMIGLSKFADFVPGSSFEAWMGQITRNVALNALRKRKRATAVLNEQANSPELRVVTRVAGHDGDHPGRTGRMDELAAAVAGLDDVARTCLLLRVVGGLPYQAIAAIMQIPESTAMSHVYRSRGHLRQWLMSGETQGSPRPTVPGKFEAKPATSAIVTPPVGRPPGVPQ